MPVINQFKQRDALQPVGTLQNYEVPWCPKPYSNEVGPDIGPPHFAIVKQSNGAVVAALQRKVAFVANPGAVTTCSKPATFTTAAYTDTYTLVPASGQGAAPTQTISGYACQGPLAWKMLPYSYESLSGEVVDDGPGGGQAVAAALRLQVPYLPSGVAGGAGCAATVFATQALTNFAYLAPGSITTLAPSTTPSVASTTAHSSSPASSNPVASPTGTSAPSSNISGATAEKIGAAVGGVLLGAMLIGVFFVYKSVKKRRANAARAAESQTPLNALRRPFTGAGRT